MRRPSSTSYRSRFSVGVPVLAFIVRALVVLVTLDVSGLAGVAGELVGANADHASECCSDCPFEKNGKECPPGCPNCHFSHGGVALPAPMPTSFVDAFDPTANITLPSTHADAPGAPVLPGVYRPPRFAVSA